tara:strand:- start:629 stop:1489 length:861 start_codon:yes stop_codon:yes gene_type:complete
MSKIVDWKQIDFDGLDKKKKYFLKYGNPKTNGNFDGFSVPVNLIEKKTGKSSEFVHQGGIMRIPFGLKRKEGNYGSRFSCDMTFPTVRKDENDDYIGDQKTLDYFHFVKQIDENNKIVAEKESKKWFKKEIKSEIIDEFYFHNLVNPKKEQEYSPTFSTKIKWENEVFKTQFFNQHGKPIEYEAIYPGLNVVPLIETRGLWFAGKSFGMSFRLIQLMVFQKNDFRGFAIDTSSFRDLIGDEEEEEEDEKISGVSPNFVMHKEEEDEEEEQEEEEEEIKTKKRRKGR